MKPSVLVLCGIVVGAMLGAAFTSRVSAQNKAAEPRFENVCEAAPSLQEANKVGARRGAAGFQLVSFSAGVACFKRDVTEPGPPAAPPPPPPARAPASDQSWPGY